MIFSTGLGGFDLRDLDGYKWADIIHLHWINHGMINIKCLDKVEKPIVWTMRDMWPMSGGCHYALDCKGYMTGCGCCPHLHSNSRNDLSRYVMNRKNRHYSQNIHFVAISQWLADCAGASSLLKDYDISVISNGVDGKEFYPVDRTAARYFFGLEENAKIVLVGATNIHDVYKGFPKFQESIKYLSKKPLYVFFGEVKKSDLENLNIDFQILGYLRDNDSLRMAYSAADVFVAPSIQEAFGKTLIESMACGTPVVAFDATGPKDIVAHKQTGYLVKSFDPIDMANGIDWVLEDDDRKKQLSFQSRIRAENEFDIGVVAIKYREIYNDILKIN